MKKIFLLLALNCLNLFAVKTTLLIKIPTKSRPNQFFKNLDKFYQKLSFKVPYHFLITCDKTDKSMNNERIIQRLKSYPNLDFNFFDDLSKVDAFNKDIENHEFDVLLAAHDDMEPLVKGYDQVIIENMNQSFPDFDGILNLNDGFVGGQCNSVPAIGKGFYKRFGYIYNPEYKALVCNVELTCVSKILKKEKIVDQILIRHNHPAWNAGAKDQLYEINEKFHDHDRDVFVKRRERNFDLKEEEILKVTPRLWSILICTIEEREESLLRLTQKLKSQIDNLGLNNEIEILTAKDKRGENTIGHKRNCLLAQSEGKYVCFLDDDDDIHDKYVEMIYEKLKNNPDCVGLTGIITFNGKNPKYFYHSIKYDKWFEGTKCYFRPPNHLNPIKRSIAVQFYFPEKNSGEDMDWSMAISNSNILKKEETIDTPYYYYLYKDK